ncbi:2-methylcitrate dehydratase [Xylariaceae sp. FL0804]|nr:2-methylcitrate dehydratase [Xylariaceae sp. FL0804]
MASAVPDVSTEASVQSNGASGGAANDPRNGTPDELVTETYVDFIVTAKYEALPATAVAKLKDLILDHVGVAAGAALGSESSGPIFRAVRAFGGAGAAVGPCTVYARGGGFAPQYAALLNGAFAHSYDFDDTYAPGTVHPGASVIPATLAAAEVLGLQSSGGGNDEVDDGDDGDGGGVVSGEDVLVALAVGYEVVCRLARALGGGSYARGFHNTATAGVFGAVAAVARLRALPRRVVADALGLAGSRAAGSMQFLDNGSWNKRLHPGFAAHDALLCIALAEQGITGASRVIEGRAGLLHAFSTHSDPTGLTAGLGAEWVFPATALKPYSACRYTHSGIELVAGIAAEARKKKTTGTDDDVLPRRMDVRLGPAAFYMVGVAMPNKLHPDNLVDAQFSNYYQLAVAWLFGAGIGFAAYDTNKFGDPRVRALCERIECIEDPHCPVWGTVIDVELDDGQVVHKEMAHPLGEEENSFSPAQVREKFRGLVQNVYEKSRAEEIIKSVDNIEKCKLGDLSKLL